MSYFITILESVSSALGVLLLVFSKQKCKSQRLELPAPSAIIAALKAELEVVLYGVPKSSLALLFSF